MYIPKVHESEFKYAYLFRCFNKNCGKEKPYYFDQAQPDQNICPFCNKTNMFYKVQTFKREGEWRRDRFLSPEEIKMDEQKQQKRANMLRMTDMNYRTSIAKLINVLQQASLLSSENNSEANKGAFSMPEGSLL